MARTVGQVEGAGHLPAARHRSGRKVTARAHANLEGGRRAVHRAEAHPRAVAQARAWTGSHEATRRRQAQKHEDHGNRKGAVGSERTRRFLGWASPRRATRRRRKWEAEQGRWRRREDQRGGGRRQDRQGCCRHKHQNGNAWVRRKGGRGLRMDRRRWRKVSARGRKGKGEQRRHEQRR